MKIKVCGMKYSKNIEDLMRLDLDYMGFIFYEKSLRNFTGQIPALPSTIQKVGVFVNESMDKVIGIVERYSLGGIQLHGDESTSYVESLRKALPAKKIIKVFGVGSGFDFSIVDPYVNLVDYFLFDTKGEKRGGNGVVFDWNVLDDYHAGKPYFLSGGIGLDQVDALQTFLSKEVAKHCIAIDVNSQFESSPAFKNHADVDLFIQKIKK